MDHASPPLAWLIINPELWKPRAPPGQRDSSCGSLHTGLPGELLCSFAGIQHQLPPAGSGLLAEDCYPGRCHFHDKVGNCEPMMGSLHHLRHRRACPGPYSFLLADFSNIENLKASHALPPNDSILQIKPRKN